MIKKIYITEPSMEIYVGHAKRMLESAIRAMGSLPYFKKCYTIEDCLVFCYCSQTYSKAYILENKNRGIITHPRSGDIIDMSYDIYVQDDLGSHVEKGYTKGIVGGWKDGEELLTTEYIFPLVDEDNASYLIEGSGASFLNDSSNYGNLFWYNADDENPMFISWKGTPTRHFRLANNINIPGLSTQETASVGVIEDNPIFTTFTPKIYLEGNLYLEAPEWNWAYLSDNKQCLVLGACVNKEDGLVYIVTQSDHYNAPANVWITESGKRVEGDSAPNEPIAFHKEVPKLGIYTTLWKEGSQVDGWDFISEHPTGRLGLPFYANIEGTSFTCSNGDMLTTIGVYTTKELVNGDGAETKPNNSYGIVFDYSFQDKFYHEAGVSSLVNLNANSYSTLAQIGAVTVTYSGEFPIAKEDISGSSFIVNCINRSFVLSGGELPYYAEVYQNNAWVDAGDGPHPCRIITSCPSDLKYRFKDNCTEWQEYAVDTSPENITEIVVTGPATWTGNFSSYTATGGNGTSSYVWSISTGCTRNLTITASQCDGTYTGTLSVKNNVGSYILTNTTTTNFGATCASIYAGTRCQEIYINTTMIQSSCINGTCGPTCASGSWPSPATGDSYTRTTYSWAAAETQWCRVVDTYTWTCP